MASTTLNAKSIPSLNSADLSSDISALLALPPQSSQTLSHLLNSTLPTPAAQPSASKLLSSFTPSAIKDQARIDAGVKLSSAYTRDMRALQAQGLEEGLEVSGRGIEGVRERAEGVQAALGQVKL